MPSRPTSSHATPRDPPPCHPQRWTRLPLQLQRRGFCWVSRRIMSSGTHQGRLQFLAPENPSTAQSDLPLSPYGPAGCTKRTRAFALLTSLTLSRATALDSAPTILRPPAPVLLASAPTVRRAHAANLRWWTCPWVAASVRWPYRSSSSTSYLSTKARTVWGAALLTLVIFAAMETAAATTMEAETEAEARLEIEGRLSRSHPRPRPVTRAPEGTCSFSTAPPPASRQW